MISGAFSTQYKQCMCRPKSCTIPWHPTNPYAAGSSTWPASASAASYRDAQGPCCGRKAGRATRSVRCNMWVLHKCVVTCRRPALPCNCRCQLSQGSACCPIRPSVRLPGCPAQHPPVYAPPACTRRDRPYSDCSPSTPIHHQAPTSSQAISCTHVAASLIGTSHLAPHTTSLAGQLPTRCAAAGRETGGVGCSTCQHLPYFLCTPCIPRATALPRPLTASMVPAERVTRNAGAAGNVWRSLGGGEACLRTRRQNRASPPRPSILQL